MLPTSKTTLSPSSTPFPALRNDTSHLVGVPKAVFIKTKCQSLSTYANKGYELAARSEVGTGLVLLFSAIFRMSVKTAMNVLMYSYFSLLRCMSKRNPRPRAAWAALRAFLDTAAGHKYCPSVLGSGYRFVTSKLDQQILVIQQQASGIQQ